jgi:hypothetical protein
VIRTLTFVFVFALLAGGAVGFFAKEVIGTHQAPMPRGLVPDRRIDERIRLYREWYHLDEEALAEIRAAHVEYYRALDQFVATIVPRVLQEIRSGDDSVDPKRREERDRLAEIANRFHERVDRFVPEWSRPAAEREKAK